MYIYVYICVCPICEIYMCVCALYGTYRYMCVYIYIGNKDLCERICFEKQGKGTLKFIHIFLYTFNVAI